ncbi:MAG: tetratricopeptide repeat protein [Candidatus Falkowbacteria bacterium]
MNKKKKNIEILVLGVIGILTVVNLTVFYLGREKKDDGDKANIKTGQVEVDWKLKGDFQEALVETEKRLKDDPGDFDSVKQLAIIKYNLRDYDGAIDAYNQMVKNNMNDFFALNGLANCYRDKKEYKDAEEYYMKAIEVNKSFTVAYNNLSIILQDQEKMNEAIEILQQGIEANPFSEELKSALEKIK